MSISRSVSYTHLDVYKRQQICFASSLDSICGYSFLSFNSLNPVFLPAVVCKIHMPAVLSNRLRHGLFQDTEVYHEVPYTCLLYTSTGTATPSRVRAGSPQCGHLRPTLHSIPSIGIFFKTHTAKE